MNLFIKITKLNIDWDTKKKNLALSAFNNKIYDQLINYLIIETYSYK